VRSIEATPRALHLILDDWREAERQASSAAASLEQAEARERADAFREEYRHAFEDALSRSGVKGSD
jgi:hypothetical protein